MGFCGKSKGNKIKVLFISYNGLLEPLLYSQGIAYLKGLTRKLEIEMVVLSFEKISFFVNSEQRQRIGNLKEELKRHNISWYFLKYHKAPAILSSIHDILLGIIFSGALVIKRKIAFIHARSYVPAVIGFVLSKVFGIPYIFDMRGFMIDDYAALGIISNNGIVQRFSKYMERIILKSSYYTVVLTQEARQIVLNLLKSKDIDSTRIETIPCCVDTMRFPNLINKDPVLLERLGLKDKFVIIYAGSLGRIYQFDKMLGFFNIAHNIIPNAHFLILTPDIDYLETEMAKNCNGDLFKNVSYFSIEPQEIARYISIADLGIAFYLPSFSRKATSPTKIGEYLAAGVPFVVNSGVGDTEKWVDQFGIGVVTKEFTPESYEASIKSLLSLISKKEEIRKRCREVSEKLLSLDIATQKYEQIYRLLISRTSGHN